MKKFISLFVFVLLVCSIQAQNQKINIPTNIQKAYDNNTRSYDGAPGENYWQNKSEYKIDVTVNPENKLLEGSEVIKYYNNSPDTLSRLVIRLYQDFYRIATNRDWEIDERAITEGVKINKLVVDGIEIDFNKKPSPAYRDGTNLFVQLENDISPQSTINIEVDWSFKVPTHSKLRMGAYGESSFFVAYWYPQVSVYDDIDGWDINEYTGTTEFYNDMNDYEVNITMPEGHLVWATGVFQNPEETLSDVYSIRYRTALNSDEVVNIVAQEDLDAGGITNKKDNIWKFKATGVPDFSFATSNKYLWDGNSVVVDDETGRRVFVDAAYNPESEDFYEVAEIGKNSVKMFSTHLPGIPFPYPKITIFNGHGGMESPMMVNDGSARTREGTVGVTSHEIAHTYFPFYMGTNERKYSWMDEGWAVMLPFDIQKTLEPTSKQRENNALQFSHYSGSEYDAPLMVLSTNLRGGTYRLAAYVRSGLSYEYLKDYLGMETFKECLHLYMNRWQGKHPAPFDFFNSFNDASGEDLTWYWKPWYFDFARADLKLVKIENALFGVEVAVENLGGLPLPVKLHITYTDNSTEIVRKEADVWKTGERIIKVIVGDDKDIKKIELGDSSIPDINKDNNVLDVTN